MHYSLAELARLTETQVVGDGDIVITELASLSHATASSLRFLSDSARREELVNPLIGAVVVHEQDADAISNGLISDDPYLTYAKLSRLFHEDSYPFGSSIHPSAYIDVSAVVAADVSVGPNAVIGPCVSIGAGSVIGPNVSIYSKVRIGLDALIGANVVIGFDGFGFARSSSGWVKIYQLGGVKIGNNVEIGAGCTIDRGALDDTVISDGVKLDDQVHIAHGCFIGERTALAGCVALAGSTRLGADVTVGGMTGFTGHLSVCDKVHIGANALVTKSINIAGTYLGGAGGVLKAREWRRNAVHFRQLDALAKRIRALEQRLKVK